MTAKAQKLCHAVSVTLFFITILGACLLLILEPQRFNAKEVSIPVIVLLFLSALGLSHRLTQRTKQKAVRYVGLLAVTVLLTFVGFFVIAGAAWIIAVSKVAATPPIFALDESALNGWTAGDTFNSRAAVTTEYAGEEPAEKLPTAGRVLFENFSTTEGGCFVMYSYYDYKTDIKAARKVREDGVTKGSALELSQIGGIPISIETPEGVKNVDILTYGITGAGSNTVQRGMSLGYAELENGHIRIDGVCPEPQDLQKTASPMESISLVKP